MKKYKKKIELKKSTKEKHKELLNLVKNINGVKIKEKIFSDKIIVYIPEFKRNNSPLSGKQFFLETKYCTSGIIFK